MRIRWFQCSSASRKFLNPYFPCPCTVPCEVSVLFSEPKIPQCLLMMFRLERSSGFSALQRAENSSINCWKGRTMLTIQFQCSSASRKFLNSTPPGAIISLNQFQCSSASRKFLNIWRVSYQPKYFWFQCSSASRKFLNLGSCGIKSALQSFQCSSASRKFLNCRKYFYEENN